MSFITFQCYACNHLLKVGADKAGKKAKCNKCGTILTIPVASTVTESVQPPPAPRPAPPPLPRTPAPAPVAEMAFEEDVPTVAAVADDDDAGYDEEPQRRDPGLSLADAWSKVKLGLLLVFIGSCVLAGAFLLYVIGYLLDSIHTVRSLTGGNPGPGAMEAALVLLRVGLVIQVAASITAGVGYAFAMLGPNKKGSMGLAIATLAVTAVQALMTLIVKMQILFDRGGLFHVGEFGTWFMVVLIQLLFCAEMILFPLYLRAVLLSLKAKVLAKTCIQFMVMACVYAGLRLLAFIFGYIYLRQAMSFNPGKAMAWITLILLWLGTFVFIGMIIWYPILLWRVRAKVK